MVTGSPAERRRFIDRIFAGVVPGYKKAYREYHRALIQRNALLRIAKGPVLEVPEFGAWTESLVESGSRLCFLRLKGLCAVAPLAAALYRELTGTRLAVRYLSTLESGETEAEMRDRFNARLSALRIQEEQVRQTLAGPHRDDYIFFVEGKDLRRHGSRGEQRTAVLALKLAEAQVLEEGSGEQVIYLLDDVFSELDPKRRKALLESTEGRQAFITTAEPSVNGDGACFTVRAGQILPV
jgi:DNA replication and repair protein RecF